MTGGRPHAADPFGALGLDPAAELGDGDVLVAWRRIAAGTHPDRADGGDPDRFAAAAAAYNELRTTSGRGEARARLREPRRRSGVLGRLAGGRSFRLALRVGAAAAAAVVGVLAAGQDPAAPALVVGALTWLVLSARRDVSPPGR